jgi:hypothetical protein
VSKTFPSGYPQIGHYDLKSQWIQGIVSKVGFSVKCGLGAPGAAPS